MIVAYVVAGFFVYMGCLLAFIRTPQPGVKYIFTAVPLAVASVALLVGLAASKFSKVGKHVGIVLTSASGFTVILVLLMAGWMNNPVYREMFDRRALEMFGDYAAGGSTIGILFCAGSICLLPSLLRRLNKMPEPSASSGRG